MAAKRTTPEILANAASTLSTAHAGLDDLLGPRPERRLPGFRNVVVFGRAVTNVLQNLRSTEPGFDAWYAPYVKEMEGDALLRFLYKLRSEILKEGTVPTTMGVHIHRLEFPADMRKFGPPPPNAGAFFIGDRYGGTGWEVRLPDGTVEKYYVGLPGDIGVVTVHMHGAPTEHLGKPLRDSRIETIASAYIAYLDRFVREAGERFRGG